MNIIGRKKEQQKLANAAESKRPEFLAVYGRRRVGKTYLVKEFFNGRFSFYATGVNGVNMRNQLRAFRDSLVEYGCIDTDVPKDWVEAFAKLKELLQSRDVKRDPANGKRIVFLDEVPWMDIPRSEFKSALDYFWNSWGSSQEDLMLIVCGSATSWIIDNIIINTGGLYNRLTGQIHLAPFTLHECEELLRLNGIPFTRSQIIETYMVFGGVPYYLNCLDRRLSPAQNIDELCCDEYGQLRHEGEQLFRSLFKHAEKHEAIIRRLSQRKSGVSRAELAKCDDIGDGEPLTKALAELEQCGFVRKYHNITTAKNGALFQIVDPFTLFNFDFLNNGTYASWSKFINTPAYNAWRGIAFETVCLNHIGQIKNALGISGVSTNEYAWKSKTSSKGAQIDLLIDRKDGVINLCEMKFTDSEYEMTKEEHDKLLHRQAAFIDEVKPDAAVHLTLVSANGIKKNKYTNILIRTIDGDELF